MNDVGDMVVEASVDMYIEHVYVNHLHNTSRMDELPHAPGFKKMRVYIYIYVCLKTLSIWLVFPKN